MLPRILLFALAVGLLLIVPVFADGPANERTPDATDQDTYLGEQLDDQRAENNRRQEESDQRKADREQLNRRFESRKRDTGRRNAIIAEERRRHAEWFDDAASLSDAARLGDEERLRHRSRLRAAERDDSDGIHKRVHQLSEAAELLADAGMHDLAREVQERVERIEQEHIARLKHRDQSDVPPVVQQRMNELSQEVRELRREVEELRGLISQRDRR